MSQAIQKGGNGNGEPGVVAMAKMLAQSQIIPKHYQGNPPNCLIAADFARNIGEPVLSIMRATFVVHGTLGFTSQFLIGRANASGIFDGPIRFDEQGEPGAQDFRVRAGAKIKGDEYWGPWVTWEMVSSEGWITNAKYKTMPSVMFRYRAATFFVRQTCPQVLSGAQTVEELEDMAAAQPREVQVETDPAAALNAAMREHEQPEERELEVPQGEADAAADQAEGLFGSREVQSYD